MRNQIEHWATKLGHHPEDWFPPSLARLCSQHFDPLLTLGGSKSTSSTTVDSLLATSDDQIRLVCSKQKLNYWKSIKEFYHNGLFCDTKIVCLPKDQDALEQTKHEGILCHSMVLAAMSPMISLAALDAVNSEEAVLYLVDYNEADVRFAIDTLYSCLAQEKEMEALTCGDVGKVFSDFGVDWSRFPRTETEAKRIKFEHNYDQAEYILDDAWEQEDIDISGASEIEDSDWNMKEEYDNESSEEVGGDVSEVEISQQRKRKREKSVKEYNGKRSKVTQERVENLNDIHNKLIAEQGMMSVNLVSKPFNAREYAARFNMMAMFGLQRPESGKSYFNAIPLAVNPKAGDKVTADDIKHYYYNRFRPAIKAVFGLSEAESTGDVICWRMGLSKSSANTISKKKYEYKRYYINHNKEELEKLLTDEVVCANQTAPSKPRFDKGLFDIDKMSAIEIQLNLVSDIASPELEGIILVTCKEDGEFSAQTLSVSEDRRQKDVNALLKTFLDVFTVHERNGTRKNSPVPKVDSMVEDAQGSTKLQALYMVVQDYLRGDTNAKESISGLGRKVCETCQEVFVLNDMKDMNNYRQHKRKHFYDNYDCDCRLGSTTVEERRRHIQLVHLKGYSLCTKCTFVGNKKFMKEHMEDRHKEFTCKRCGESFNGRISFNEHIESTCEFVEPDVIGDGILAKSMSSKLINQQFENHSCECDVEFSNFDEKKKHVQLFHMKGQVQCPEPECARVMRKSLLVEHVKRLHQEITCESCGMDLKGTTAYSHHMRYKHNVKVPQTSVESTKKSNNLNSRYVNLSPFHPHPSNSQVPQQTEPCVDCGKTFDCARQLYAHWNDKHRQSKCLECGIKFNGDYQRKVHTKQFHTVEDSSGEFKDRRTVVCEECGSTLANKYSLKTHIKNVHRKSNSENPEKKSPKEKELYICEHCNMS